MRTKVIPVVGVTFVDTYPHNLLALADVSRDAEQRGERLTVVLVRNPANAHDANAVEVHVPALGEYAMVGHVSRDNAARLAPLMDDGVRFSAEVAGCRIVPARLDRPGIDIAISRAPVQAVA